MHHLRLAALFLGLGLAGCAHQAAPAPTSSASERKAVARQAEKLIYEDKKPAEALVFYRRLWDMGERDPRMLYNTACVAALAGEKQEALLWLDRTADAGMSEVEQLEQDPDLASLRDDPAYAKVVEKVKANDARRNVASDPALRDEVLTRVDVDQTARRALFENGQQPTPEKLEKLRQVDEDNTQWMKGVLAKHGWPTRTLVGAKASQGVWLLVQHADQDLAFQKECLPLLEKAVAAGEAEGKQLAYLTDRVRVAEGQPQRYGTQFTAKDGVMVPQPIEAADQVDARRAAVGLDTMEDYAAQMQRTYGKPASPIPLPAAEPTAHPE